MASKNDPVSLALNKFQQLRSAGALGVWDMQGKHLMRRPDPNAVRRAIEEVALDSYRLGVDAGQQASAMTEQTAKALEQETAAPAPAKPRVTQPESRIATKKAKPSRKGAKKAAKKKSAKKSPAKKAAKKAAKKPAKKSAKKATKKKAAKKSAKKKTGGKTGKKK